MIEAPKRNRFAFAVITSLFFLWGFATVIIDILIPYYKREFQLNDAESMMVDLAFFGSYGVWALCYYIWSFFKGDPINKLGYKNGIVAGLLISAFACFLYYPVTYIHNYFLALIPLFMLGMGFTILQISCNPYIAILGPKETASSRLNLSQGFNSLGTTLSPIFIGYLMLSYLKGDDAIQVPYGILALTFAILGLIVMNLNLPEPKVKNEIKGTSGALKFPHLRFGMLAIFFYVGAEVAIGSKLLEYVQLGEIGSVGVLSAPSFVGMYWGGAMIGRLTVATITSNKYGPKRQVLYGLMIALLTFVFLLITVGISLRLDADGLDLSWGMMAKTFKDVYPLLFFVVIQFVLMVIFRKSSRKLLSVFAIVAMSLVLTAFIAKGEVALWSMVSIGLFNSIMWSNIFTLAIEDLKEYTSQGSSLLIIMIVGGAVIPMLMGVISDKFNLMTGYLLPVISYLYIAFFGIYGSKIKSPVK